MSPYSRPLTLLAVSLAASLALAGCTADGLADQYKAGSAKNYVAGDGSVTEIAAESRGAAVTFEGQAESGEVIRSEDYADRVLVVNFWYAGCPPCRSEAPDLERLNVQFQDQGVRFLGVNVRDQADTALEFAGAFGVTYPSILDVDTGSVQLAFSGSVAPNAVPTTLVLDRRGRVAARVLGRIDASILETLIADVLAEEPQ